MKKIILLFCTNFFFLQVQAEPYLDKEKEFPVKNTIIPLLDTDIYLQTYAAVAMTIPVMYRENDTDFLAAFNPQIYSLDILNITDKIVYKQIRLQKEGPNGILNPTGLGYYKGKFVISTSKGYHLVDKEGHITSTRVNPSVEDLYKKGYGNMKEPNILFNIFNSFPFDPETGSIALIFYPEETNHATVKQDFLIRIFSLETEDTEDIRIPYPAEFTGKVKWGIMNDLKVSFNKDKLIYNFAGSFKIYTFDRKTKAIEEYKVPSQYIDNLLIPKIMPGDGAEPSENFGSLTAGYYYSVQYDPFRNVYWRIQMGPSSNVFSINRVMSISKISPDFKTSKEIPLPKEQDIYVNLFIGKDGVWLDYQKGKMEEELWLLDVPVNF